VLDVSKIASVVEPNTYIFDDLFHLLFDAVFTDISFKTVCLKTKNMGHKRGMQQEGKKTQLGEMKLVFKLFFAKMKQKV
jgi:hypothetical protein